LQNCCPCLLLTLEIICACSDRFVPYLLQVLLLYLLIYYLTVRSFSEGGGVPGVLSEEPKG